MGQRTGACHPLTVLQEDDDEEGYEEEREWSEGSD